MAPTTSSIDSSNSGKSPDALYRVVRKRNRVPLSCGPCRHRKLKCDRSNPCQNCVKRGDAVSCAYAAPASRKRSNQVQAQATPTSPDDMQNRIDRLEGLVLSLMTNGSQSAGTSAAAAAVLSTEGSSTSSGQLLDSSMEETQMLDDGDDEAQGDDSDTDRVTKSFGIMKVDPENKKTLYIGAGHWAAVLNDIAEVRNYFQTHKTQFDEQMKRVAQSRKDLDDDSGPALLFGASLPPPRSELISQLPSRYLTDILIARYFNNLDPGTHILHGPVFQKQYNAHWADPAKSSIVWIGMLFAMLRIALLSYASDGDEPAEFAGKSKDLSNMCRTAVANCLILADYTKPHQHIIETLIFHLHAEFRRNRDSEASVWVLIGMIVRLAMRMGYHRDSKMFPNITPFQGEMRRRVWTFARQSDLLFSFQMSLPAMIRIGDSDTDLPRNIYDEEFDEDTTVLPPSRPASEPTTVSYMITKARLAFGFGRVLEEVNGVRSKSYEEILEIDKGIREIFKSVPDHLKLRPMNEQCHLPVAHIIARFHIAAVYHKSQCVLHRKFLRSARNNPRYSYSRRTCLESAMALMDFQNTMHRETRESGQLRNAKSWFTSLTAHDFLLAATVISMDLYLDRQRAEANAASAATSPKTNFSDSNSGRSGSTGGEAYGLTIGMEYSQEDLLRSLEESRDVWTSLCEESMEAYKASEVLKVLLAQLKAPVSPLHGTTDQQKYADGNHHGVRGQVDEKQNAAMTLGLLSSGGKSADGNLTAEQIQNQRALGSMFDSTSSIEGVLQTSAATPVPNGGAFDTQSTANAPNPFLGMFGASSVDVGGGMYLDWDAFDSYIQSSNLSLDPANTLWSSLSPNIHAFPTNISPTNDMPSNARAEMASTFYPPQNMPCYRSDSNPRSASNSVPNLSIPLDPSMQGSTPSDENSPGQVFMGRSSPQPGGLPAWRWNTMSTKQR